MDNLNFLTRFLNWFRGVHIPVKVVGFVKNYKKYIIGALAGVALFLIIGTIKSFFSFRKTAESIKASDYQYFRRTEVESLKTFVKLQTQIDSLETIKAEKRKEIFEDPKVDLQEKLNLIFNK